MRQKGEDYQIQLKYLFLINYQIIFELILQLMQNKHSLTTNTTKIKHHLQKWQKQNHQLILQLQQTLKINQKCLLPQQFLQSNELKMYKLKKSQCQLCRLDNNFKFVRKKDMIGEQQNNCSIFLICQNCLKEKDKKMSVVIDKSSYQSMDRFLQRIKTANSNLKMEPGQYDLLYQKYDYFQKCIYHTLNQIDKVVFKSKQKICKKLLYEIEFIKTLIKKKGYHEIDQLVFKTQTCNCLFNCCYCDFKLSNDEFLKKNCKYYDLKLKQNQLIKKVNMLNIINKQYVEKYQKNVLDSIIKQIQSILIKNIFPIQQNLKKIQKQCQNLSFSLQANLNDIILKYQLINEQNNNKQTLQQIIIDTCRDKYKQNGIINHMTYQFIDKYPIETTSITLNSHHISKDVIKNMLPKFQHLNKLYIQNNQIGSLIINQNIKILKQQQFNNNKQKQKQKQKKEQKKEQKQKQQKLQLNNNNNKQKQQQKNKKQKQQQQQQLYKKQQQQKSINLNNYNNLQSISFNCKINYSKELFDSMNNMKTIKQFYFNWNFYQSIQKLNQSIHFLQDKAFINSNAPHPKLIKDFYSKYKLRNLWVGKCGRKVSDQQQQSQMIQDEIIDYLNILNDNTTMLQGIMIGQFDGISRIIHPNIYQQINLKNNIKTIFLNKIQIDNIEFKKFINRNKLSIEVLYFNQCQNIGKIIEEDIYMLPKLKKLGIIQIRNIKFSQSIPTIETFILQHCFDYFDETLVTFLSLSKLKHLSFNSCSFLADSIISKIVKNQIKHENCLQTLNLGYTRLNNVTIRDIDKLINLRCLDIGGTQIDIQRFMRDLTQNKIKNLIKLQKLSLKEMKEIKNNIQNKKISQQHASQYYNDLFSTILSYFPILSHLDISYNEVIDQRAIRFYLPNLTYLTVTETKYKLRTKQLRNDHSGLVCPFMNGNKLIINQRQSNNIKEDVSSESKKGQASQQIFSKKQHKYQEYIKIIL